MTGPNDRKLSADHSEEMAPGTPLLLNFGRGIGIGPRRANG